MGRKRFRIRPGSCLRAVEAPKPIAAPSDPERLFSEIGRLKVELDWLKKVWAQPVVVRQAWVSKEEGGGFMAM